ncbi:MAG: hypothetical protein F7C07_05100 [Desulfurococcales archaeon]|nr:hypothetical protein [Desulfurococcales archaeon]
MAPAKPSERDLLTIEAVLAYQFDYRVARAIAGLEGLLVEYSRRGKIKYVYWGNERILTRRPTDGLFTLSITAGRIVAANSKTPRFRVIVEKGYRPLGSVLVKHLVDLDENLRPGDEVIIVDPGDNLIGVGRLRLPPIIARNALTGEVVRVRKKVKKNA